MSRTPAPTSPTGTDTVATRRFWVLLPVAAVLFAVFHFWWPDAPGALRALVGTVVLVATATVVVLRDNHRRPSR